MKKPLKPSEVYKQCAIFLKNGFWACEHILTYGAVINIIRFSRNWGKTTAFKIRAALRYIRRGRGTYWVRRTKGETQKTKKAFFDAAFFAATRLTPDEVRITGDTAEILIREKWHVFIEFCTLSQARKERSAQRDGFDTMIIDEGQATARARNQYHGDEITDALDLWVSKKRNCELRLFILGNRESALDVYAQYFGLPKIAPDFDGVKLFRNGSIAYEQHNWEARTERTKFEDKVFSALDGTAYGAYMYGNASKEFGTLSIKPKPKNAAPYCCFDFGTPVTAWANADGVYFTSGLIKGRRVIVPALNAAYGDNARVYANYMRNNFYTLIEARRTNSIYFDSDETGEAAFETMRRMGL